MSQVTYFFIGSSEMTDCAINLVPRGPFCHALEKSGSPSLTKRIAASGNEIAAQCKTKDVLTTHRIRSSLNHHDWMFHFIYKSSFDSLTKLIRNLIHCTQWKHRKKLVDLSKQAGVCKWRNLPGTARNQPEPPQPPGTNRNPPEPTRNLEKSANDKIKKKNK